MLLIGHALGIGIYNSYMYFLDITFLDVSGLQIICGVAVLAIRNCQFVVFRNLIYDVLQSRADIPAKFFFRSNK